MFGQNIRVIYLYLVSFVALMMIVGGLISTVNSTINYVMPTRYDYTDKNMYSSTKFEVISNQNLSAEEKQSQLDLIEQQEEAQAKINAEQQESYAKTDSFNTLKSIIMSCVVWLIATPLFVYHWRQIQKDKVRA
ncbi:MAG TPA: hypothetical protein DCY20_08980 [Firmicutes bacterium]|nr:hypothetical protein [Bacillota bacterium]